MFCPECGAKNNDDAVFCENCGADISQALKEADDAQNFQPAGRARSAQTPFNAFPEENPDYAYAPTATVARKPVKTSTKIAATVVLAVLIAGFALFQGAKSMTSPEKVAGDYFAAIKSQNWDTVYSYLDVSGSGFLTEKNFVKIQKKADSDQSIANYSVLSEKQKTADDDNSVSSEESGKDGKTMPGGLVEEVTVQYTTHGNASPETKVVSLIKQPEKKWLFFDTWKVSPADYITPEVDVTVPSGMTVSIDDVKLDDKYKDQDGNNSSGAQNSDNSNQNGDTSQKYTLKNIFSGKYTLKVVSPYTEDISKSVDISESNTSFEFNQFTLKKEVLDSVAKQPEEIIKALYASALSGKDYDSVSSYFVPDDGNGSGGFKDGYEQLKNQIASGSNPGFQSIDFSNFNSEAEANGMEINVDTKFDYSYTAINATYDSEFPAQPYNGRDNAQVQMRFRLVNGKWLAESMDNINLSYSNNSSEG